MQQRLTSGAQWTALAVCDGGCVAPGCDRPVAFCQAHHLSWWNRDGGTTDLENLTHRQYDPRRRPSQAQVEPHRLVDICQQPGAKPSNDFSDTLHRDGPDLLSLRLGGQGQPARSCREQYLKGIDISGLARHRDHGDHASIQTSGHAVRAVIADHDGGPSLVGFTSSNRVEVNPYDVAPSHQRAEPESPSLTVESQAPSSDDAHSSHAAA